MRSPSNRPASVARSALLACAVSLIGAPALAQDEGDWIGTWTASPKPVWGPDFFAPVGIPRALRDQTIRQVARVSLGGKQVRVELSNDYGDAPVTIGAATIGMAGEDGAADGIKPLTFGGRPRR